VVGEHPPVRSGAGDAGAGRHGLSLGSDEQVPHFFWTIIVKNTLIHEIEAFMQRNHPKVEIVGTAYLRKTNTILLRGRCPEKDGSVRFVVETENNCFVSCREITTSERKRLGKAAQKYRNKRGKKHAAQ
tara:strand:+ start:492 stop:878 length:387 start_codon:yes stop_codon:yes gene_type:complete